MAKLQGAEHNKKGRGLEYLYLNVHDEDIDGKFPVPVAKEYNCTWVRLHVIFCVTVNL